MCSLSEMFYVVTKQSANEIFTFGFKYRLLTYKSTSKLRVGPKDYIRQYYCSIKLVSLLNIVGRIVKMGHWILILTFTSLHCRCPWPKDSLCLANKGKFAVPTNAAALVPTYRKRSKRMALATQLSPPLITLKNGWVTTKLSRNEQAVPIFLSLSYILQLLS